MTSLPARTGWQWIRQGFDLFRQQPGRLAFLFLGYMLFIVFVELIPVVGKPLTLMLLPVFGAAFMRAGARIDRGEPVEPGLIVTGFRKPVFAPLFKLGLLYFGVIALVVGAIMWMDDGTLAKMAQGQLDPRSPEAQSAQLWKPFLAALLIYLPATAAIAFAVPLILWRGMGVAKSMFYSFFAVWRNLRAFIMFALGWFLLFVFATQLVALFSGPKYLALALQPVIVMFGIIAQCSLYASYRQLFGTPEPDSPPPAVDTQA
jgi:hypothetical protein